MGAVVGGLEALLELRGRREGHMPWVEKLLASAEGGAEMLHSITMGTSLKNRVQVIEDVVGDAQPKIRVEVKRQDCKSHWHEDTR